MKGYKLIKLISKGKIKDGTKIHVTYNNQHIDIKYKNGRLEWKEGTFSTKALCVDYVDFEVIKDVD